MGTGPAGLYNPVPIFSVDFCAIRREEPRDGEFLPWLFTFGDFHLVPVALAIRLWRYGHWIDDAIAWVNGLLADPETQATLAWIANPEIRARLSDPEGRVWLIEQLARRHAESPG